MTMNLRSDYEHLKTVRKARTCEYCDDNPTGKESSDMKTSDLISNKVGQQ